MVTTLFPHEAESLIVIARELCTGSVIERDSLRIRLAARGSDFGRDFLRLRELGLIAELEGKQSLFRRLLGGSPKRLITLTELGWTTVASLSDRNGAFRSVYEIERLRRTISVTDTAVSAPEALEETPPVTAAAVHALEVVSVQTQQKNASLGGKLDSASQQKLQRSERIVRFAPTDYTDVLGGIPDDSHTAVPESPVIDELHSAASELGFELMPSGRFLATTRLIEGRSFLEILLEILVASIAYAIKLDRNGTAQVDQMALINRLALIETTLVLRSPDIDPESTVISQAMETMRCLAEPNEHTEAILNELMSDPIRAMAPPAVCPDEIWRPIDRWEDDHEVQVTDHYADCD